jgi:hypothetical protein
MPATLKRPKQARRSVKRATAEVRPFVRMPFLKLARVEAPPAKRLKSKILPGGVLRAVHVYVPTLQQRLAEGGDKPVMAVRLQDNNGEWRRMKLYRKVEWAGPGRTELIEHFDAPLPGTNGRGVAIVYTDAPLAVFWDERCEPKMRLIRGD